MPIFKRKISEADQFKTTTDASTASDLDINLDSTGATGIYKKSDTQIAIALSNADVLNILKGRLTMADGNLTSAPNISIWISGGSLQYTGSAGTTTRLAIP